MVPEQMRLFVLSFLRRIVEPKIEKVTGAWRKFSNEECHDLYLSPKYY
jgi:hypothetical protein